MFPAMNSLKHVAWAGLPRAGRFFEPFEAFEPFEPFEPFERPAFISEITDAGAADWAVLSTVATVGGSLWAQ